MTHPRLLGAVLAGGRSRRYGQPKHAVTVGGVPMVARALRLLQPFTEQLVVVSPRPVDGAGKTLVLADRVPDQGPLGGLHAALHAAVDRELDGVVLMACDLPLVDGEVVSALITAASSEGSLRTVAPAREGGGIEPLCAVYEAGLLPLVEDHVERDDLSLHALFREAGGQIVDLGADAFLNVNTPQDRDRAEASLNERERR